ncbi:CbrC family protein [Saccharothrix syringae]|uniref:CbrC family protein n=1 Tax=Saccharothrix syringae TaxID=103733 RepID=A0A5Q0GYB8_SACSY|nr:CbrC family protein [Saccharothrix syringae]QFZ18893.1 CbrC family protein [Saccharothrix syringae]
MDSPPTFRFSPNAYALGFIVAEPVHCSCCDRDRDWRYRGSFYTATPDVRLCPWCIADGSAATRFDGEFSDRSGIDGFRVEPGGTPAVDPDAAEEVATRTPSYPSWQQEQWRVHCGLPCAFIGFAGADDLPLLLPDPVLADDVDGGTGFPGEVLRAHLSREGDLSGYLFRCLTCGAHRLHVDAS